MNAIQLLTEDHKNVKGLFEEYESLGERALAKKRELAEKICSELDLHTQIEEKIFYPAVQKSKSPKEAKDLVFEAFEEHKVAKTLVAEIQEFNKVDDVFEAKMKVLMESVRHHIKEEEGELFPEVKKTFKQETLETLGTRMEEMKEKTLGSDFGEDGPKKSKSSQAHVPSS
jgi:hemerythrin-like domain-containing protein